MSNAKKSGYIPLLSYSAGFTLIELMVVFALSAVMAGGGFFAFTKYARSQELNRAMEEFKLSYEQARNYAISNVKPIGDCDTASTLRGYRIDLTNTTHRIVLECTSGDKVTVHNLPDRVRLRNVGGGNPTDCNGIEFQVITGNVKGPVPCTIQIYHQDVTGSAVDINISQDGRVTFN
jgi:prepilin-type N-terminal cleavage/methylation domain-containing protein